MNILIDINHPGHVHLFKNVYRKMTESGNNITVTVKDIPIAKQLLSHYNIPYIDIGKKKDSIFMKGVIQLYYDHKLFSLVRSKKIEIGIGSSISLAHVSSITSMKSIILDDDDDEVEPLFVKFGHLFADVVLSPSPVQRKTGKNIFYQGIHELAYLHPNVFTPDKSVLNDIGLEESEPFFVLRCIY